MRTRPNARGAIELHGPTWYLRRWILEVDGETGELRRRRARIPIGPRTELRTHRAARQAADLWLAQQLPEVLMPGRQILAVQYLEHFLATHVPPMRPTSQIKYRHVIRGHLAPALAGLRLAEVNTAAMRELINGAGQRLARATVGSIRGILLQVLRQAIRDGFGACRIDPRDVRLPATSVEEEPEHFDQAALEQILEASEQPWRALWALMGYAGLRIGEALGLTADQVDLEARLLRLRQAAVRGRLAPLKTTTSRADVPIVDALAGELAPYLAAWSPNPSRLLFATRRGTPYAADDVRRRKLQPLLNALCLPHAGCHAFRHGLPARLAAAGVSPDMIQRVMRHSTLAMTEQYLHTKNQDTVRSLQAAGLMRAGAGDAHPS